MEELLNQNKMTASELRIGNFFILPNGEIGKITYHEIRLLTISTEKPNYKPIPLTREWLIKFKFEELEKDCRTFFKKGKFKVELSNGGNVYYNRNIFISSVHQLQNLYFALTGEELTFKSE